MKKDYSLPEEDMDSLNEYSMEYQTMDEASLKMEAIREIMDMGDLNGLRKIVGYIKSIGKKNPPCQFNVAQLKKELELSEKEIQEGNVYTMEELRKRHPLC